jgi:hypothetical protein
VNPLDQPGKGDDALTVPEGFHDAKSEAPTAGRDRAALAAEVELDPMSLSGSYCHRCEGGEPVEDGLVVGEVQPGKYLVKLETGQRVVPLDQIIAEEWRFYDTEQERTLAWAEYLAKERSE